MAEIIYIFVVVLAVIVGLDSFSVIPILYSMMTKLVGDQDQGEFTVSVVRVNPYNSELFCINHGNKYQDLEKFDLKLNKNE